VVLAGEGVGADAGVDDSDADGVHAVDEDHSGILVRHAPEPALASV
jgi:hypothetical protein